MFIKRKHGPKLAILMAISTMPLLSVAACSPTIKVEAPDRPIEINLNIRIEQEVRIKLDQEVTDLFQDNPDLF